MRFEYWKNKSSRWNFRIRAGNGDILASSSQGYENKQDCINTMNSINDAAEHRLAIKELPARG